MTHAPDNKRLRAEDFDSKDQALITKLSYPINTFFDQVVALFNKNIDFDNLNRQLSIVTVNIDGGGNVINSPQVKYTLRGGRISGLNVISATNLDNLGTYPTSAPFVSYTFSAGILTINNVTGLQNNSRYNLTLELIG